MVFTDNRLSVEKLAREFGCRLASLEDFSNFAFALFSLSESDRRRRRRPLGGKRTEVTKIVVVLAFSPQKT
jgi:hypothetical protein